MKCTYTQDQQSFRDSAGKVFSKRCSPSQQRALWQDETGRDPDLWADLVELGVPAILVPEEFDGLGGTEVDLLAVLEEAGRQGVPDALVESVFVGPYAIAVAANAQQQRRWLPGVATGGLRVTVGLGNAHHVPDVHVSDLIVLERSGELWVYHRDELEVERVGSQDPSRRIFAVTPRPGAGERLPLGAEALGQIRARERVGSAAVLNGISQHLLDAAVEYAKVRRQFNRVIGSFQGVKHLLADAASRIHLATLAVRSATWRVATGQPEALEVAEFARICAVEAEFVANRVSLQVHGGIGFTFEHDLQLWLKRGKVLEQTHGGHRAAARRAGMTVLTKVPTACAGTETARP